MTHTDKSDWKDAYPGRNPVAYYTIICLSFVNLVISILVIKELLK